MVKTLAKQTKFDGPFGAVAMQKPGWACTDEHRAAKDRDELAARDLDAPGPRCEHARDRKRGGLRRVLVHPEGVSAPSAEK